jgi:hypothetical protein
MPTNTRSERFGCNWNSIFAPPIDDKVLFGACNEAAAFRGWTGQNDVWTHIRAARSSEEPNVRSIISTILAKLEDDVLVFLGPRMPIRNEEEAQAESDSLYELIFWVLQDVAEFMKIGDGI